jgi:hypothetical protein
MKTNLKELFIIGAVLFITIIATILLLVPFGMFFKWILL